MKNYKFLIVLIFSILGFSLNAQTAKEMLAEINGKWILDDNGNVTLTRTVDATDLSANEIYNRTISYFIYNYESGKSAIQIQDRENGFIVGKGLYVDVHFGVSFLSTYISTWHIIRVDVKEGRARLIITLNEYEKNVISSNSPPLVSFSRVQDEYPINPKGNEKTVMTKASYKSYHAALATLNSLEKAIKEGNTSKSIENKEW